MRNWQEYVRDRLHLEGMKPERVATIVREVAEQLEEFYNEARGRGASETEAESYAIRQVKDWQCFESDIRRADHQHRRARLDRWQDRAGSGGSHRGGLLLMLDDLAKDLVYGMRMLRRNLGFTIVAVLTLTLGIGANTAMFSIVNGVILRPLPYFEPDELVQINPRWKEFGFGSMNAWEYFDIQERTDAFEDIAIYRWASMNLTEGDGEPQQVLGVRTTPSLLSILGVQPALGRPLRAGEEFAGDDRVVLISDRLWKSRFGADPDILGRTLPMLNDTYEIIGVMPAGFSYPSKNADLWAGYGIDRENMGGRGEHSSYVLARLKRGVAIEAAQAQLTTLSAELRKEFSENYPESSGFTFTARQLLDVSVGGVRPALMLLMGAVVLVLLIACANVANLLLARITAREKELAIRSALGAGRGRMVRQMVAEMLLLSVLGGMGAIAFALTADRGLRVLFPSSLPRLEDVGVDSAVLLFTFSLVLFSTLAVGLISSIRLDQSLLAEKLKEGGRSGGGALRQRMRTALIVAEVALATVLLMGAGLLLRSFQQLVNVNPGFRAENVLTTRLSLSPERYPDHAARVAFMRQAAEALTAQPDIVAAAFTNILPMSGGNSDWSIVAEGYTPPNPELPDFIQYRIVSPDYFKALGIPVIHGRSFTDQDAEGTQPVVVISESLAMKYWGDADAVGRRIKPGGPNSSAPWHTVVGIVGDVHHDGAREGKVPIWYRCVYANSWSWTQLAVRTTGDPAGAARTLHDVIRSIDPNQPISNTRAMTQMVADSLSQDRFNASLLVVFAGLALSLAAIGIFGVISYSVGQRTHEFGIRMVLGAQTGRILTGVMREGLTLVLVGLGLGLAGTFALTRFMETMLFGVTPADPITFVSIAAVLLGSGLLACLLPARRATQVDPMVALRYE